jgi:hypothetical protein
MGPSEEVLWMLEDIAVCLQLFPSTHLMCVNQPKVLASSKVYDIPANRMADWNVGKHKSLVEVVGKIWDLFSWHQ